MKFVAQKCFQFGQGWKFVIWKGFNPFLNKPWFLRVCSTSLLKTLWEKEKLSVTSNLSLSHNVLYSFGELFSILSNLNKLSANSFSLEEYKICRLGKELRINMKMFSNSISGEHNSQNRHDGEVPPYICSFRRRSGHMDGIYSSAECNSATAN